MNRALVDAADRGNLQRVRELLDAGADPNEGVEGISPLYFAIKQDNFQVVQVLLDAGADPNQMTGVDADDRLPPLYLAIIEPSSKENRYAIILDLLDAGADPNFVLVHGDHRSTVLGIVTRQDELDLVRELLIAGADPNAGDTMFTAVDTDGPNHLAILRELLQWGADPNKRHMYGNVVFINAVAAFKEGRLTVIQELLAAGADPNIRDRGGATALTMAAIWQNVPVIRELLEWGADPTLADNHGRTPLDYPVVQRAWREFNGPRLVLNNMNLLPEVSDMVYRNLYRR
jgi:ankyrin repeat protein